MANTIITKKKSTTGAPVPGDLVEGELAVNTFDQKLYSKDATTVFEIGAGLPTGTTEHQVLDWDSGAGEWRVEGTGVLIDTALGASTSGQVIVSPDATTAVASSPYYVTRASATTGYIFAAAGSQSGDTWGIFFDQGPSAANEYVEFKYVGSTSAIPISMRRNGQLYFNDNTARIGSTGSVFIKEKAAADTDVLTFGQLWVKTVTPNQLWFTDDAGGDFPISELFATASTQQGQVPGSNSLGATYYLDGSGAWSVPGGGSGTVTSVSAGDGLDFTTITATGPVTLGTPSALTASTTDAVTSVSHTHSITGFVDTTGDTMTGILNLDNAAGGEMLLLQDTGSAGSSAVAYIGFDDSASTRQGYIGLGSGANPDIYLAADIGDVRLQAGGGQIIFEDDAYLPDNISLQLGTSADIDMQFNATNLIMAGAGQWQITGFTGGIQAGTIDADFDAITGTSYGGITEANLVDKAADEVVSGAWSVPSEILGKTASYTMILGDAGKTVRFTGATASKVCTIPANASVAYPIGTMIGVTNDGTVAMTLVITTDTMTWGKDNTTGTRTLAAGADCVIHKTTATTWKINGSALVT